MGKFSIKNFELFLYTEIWHLGYFDYVQFDGDVGFFLFEAENTFFLGNFGLEKLELFASAEIWHRV